MRPRPFLVLLSFLLIGAGLGIAMHRSLPFHSFPRLTPDREAWGKLTPDRQKSLSIAHERFLAMNTEKRRLIQDRWQYYRHLPAWRQEEMLREFEQWKKIHPNLSYPS